MLRKFAPRPRMLSWRTASIRQLKGNLLLHIDQTDKICLEEVSKNGLALQYVKHQTPEICLAAVKQNGLALDYVKERTPEIVIEAIKEIEHSGRNVDARVNGRMYDIVYGRLAIFICLGTVWMPFHILLTAT